MAEKLVYPKLPESNWWTLRNQFKKTIPGTVTISYLKSLLKLTSDKAASNLLSPLKQFGLIENDNRPTQRANDWRSDTKYKDTCDKIITEIYPQELRDLYLGPNLNRKAIKEWFMSTATLGDGAAGQCAAVYILLNEGIPKDDDDSVKKVKNYSPTPKKSIGKTTETKETKKSGSVETDKVSSFQPTVSNQNSQNNSPTLHIDLQIHISPNASLDQIDAIFSSIAKHIYRK